MRIVLDLSKPISRGRFLHVRDKPIWINFKYETLPGFCFKSGIIRHGCRGCVAPGGRKNQGNGDGTQFGPWLRVTPGGHRIGEARGGRRDGAWRNTGQPSNYSATSNGGDERRASGGHRTVAMGGASTGTSETLARAKKGKFPSCENLMHPFNASGISGDPLSQGREGVSPGDNNEAIRER